MQRQNGNGVLAARRRRSPGSRCSRPRRARPFRRARLVDRLIERVFVDVAVERVGADVAVVGVRRERQPAAHGCGAS